MAGAADDTEHGVLWQQRPAEHPAAAVIGIPGFRVKKNRLVLSMKQPFLAVFRPGGGHAVDDYEKIRVDEDDLPERLPALFRSENRRGITRDIGVEIVGFIGDTMISGSAVPAAVVKIGLFFCGWSRNSAMVPSAYGSERCCGRRSDSNNC